MSIFKNRTDMADNTYAELLAPAGNLEKLKIALAYGADAVYGSTSTFSLRIRSGKEFDMDSYAEGITYAHNLGKKVYATVNSFPFNSQIKLYENHIAKIAELSPDALIVSSPGVVKIASRIAPDIPIHLSTQANVMNAIDAEVYYDLGVKRIIVAREISLKDCEAIKSHLPDLELEVFVHGSMCFAYSGRCLVSALQTGRVPNRGSCANDCRFPYEIYAHNPESGTTFRLEEESEIGTYIMNAKDMNMASHVDKILSSGVIDSLKIEGRTKSPYYAGVVTKAYRHAIDDYYAGDFEESRYQAELNTTQNRGFTDAYLVSKPFERNDTQSLGFTIQNGSHQVAALVSEDGKTWRCKDKSCIGDSVEIVLPVGASLEPVDNEYGTIELREGSYWLTFKKIISVSGKLFECIHSGDLNDIILPATLPGYTILRRGISEAMEKKGLVESDEALIQRFKVQNKE
jgi:putative protease